MPFNSVKYLLFLPVVYLAFICAGERFGWIVLLAASLLFYAALKVPYLLAVLALATTASYAFGIWIHRAGTPKARAALLWGGIAANLSLLVVMKYLPFLSENLNALSAFLSFGTRIEPLHAFVAIGVSYYVFQAISYLLDIFFGTQEPERHFGYFALYLCFFPKLLQGPIERAGDLIVQLKSGYRFDYDNMRLAMLLFTSGLFKKVVVADRLGFYVDHVYNNVHAFTGLPLLLATYAYAFQIYTDFSSYTDMALGSALLFNIRLTQNFNAPYLATSVADFWRRWHITFSRWILDYVFTPVQMELRYWKKWGTAAALIAAFLVSGFWHGASWGFVIWGGLHGLFMACSVFYKPYQKKLHRRLGIENTALLKAWQIFVTFNLVSFAWIFFRAATVADAWYVVSKLLAGLGGGVEFLLCHGKKSLLLLAALFAVNMIWAARRQHLVRKFQESAVLRWGLYYLLFYASVFTLATSSSSGFIYYKF